MIPWSNRQGFLGERSDDDLLRLNVAVIGASGGGSHIIHETVHIGFGHVHLIDLDFAEAHHGHRMLGITTEAIENSMPKVLVQKESACRIPSQSTIYCHEARWEDCDYVLRSCDVVFSCVDSYLTRDSLEKYCRRFLIPIIDIGMDVIPSDSGHQIVGQIITSVPGKACMRCLGFLRENMLKEEAAKYGSAGPRPQVIWPNATIASIAVGIAVAMFLPWHSALRPLPYYEYDGNLMTVRPHPRLKYIDSDTCNHYKEVGEIDFAFSVSEISNTSSASRSALP